MQLLLGRRDWLDQPSQAYAEGVSSIFHAIGTGVWLALVASGVYVICAMNFLAAVDARRRA